MAGNKTTQIAGMVLGALIIWPIVKSAIKKGTDSYFAFVTDPNGEPIFENPSSPSAITRLEENAYVGALTGNKAGDYIEVETEIDQTKYQFWILKSKVSIVQGRTNANAFLTTKGAEKTQVQKNAIVNHFI